MQITVQGRSMRGHPHLARAGRFWPTSEPKLVEVLDQEKDPPEVTVPWKNPTTGKLEERLRPDPDRIGLATYRILSADTRLVIKETGAVNQQAADAAIGAAREEVTRLSAINVELKARVAALEAGDALKAALAENAELKTAVAKLTADNAELSAHLEAATAPSGDEKPAATPAEKAPSKRGDAQKA